jgi:hypothetical protein
VWCSQVLSQIDSLVAQRDAAKAAWDQAVRDRNAVLAAGGYVTSDPAYIAAVQVVDQFTQKTYDIEQELKGLGYPGPYNW